MIDPISLTTLAIQHDMQRMNVAANNAVNILTTGFKREYLVAAGQMGVEPAALNAHSGNTILPAGLRSALDFRPGALKQTAGALDLALLGDGFFEIQSDNGTAYTRQGNFRLDEGGRLVTQAGFPIMGVSGEIFLTTPTPVIDRAGKIYDQGKELGQIKLVSFDSTNALASIGTGMVVATDNATPQINQRARVAQGQLESSNVDSAQEMVRMLETFRHFEMSHRILQAYDELNDKSLRNLGQF
ncbi:flagellar hook-basal body protein [Pseudomethylobacillus aquaticus]|nr:flagellar hook basal-body protein [Pseudomethylobacillus aquaticus]